jgi:hypothetical protein
MKISSTNLGAAALILALGLPVSGANAAAPGLGAPPPVAPRVIVWRGHERRAIDEARRDGARRDRRNEPAGFDAASPGYDAAPWAYDETPDEAPAPVALCPPPFGPAYRSTGPRIIEIGARDASPPPGGWPVVIYGDYFR